MDATELICEMEDIMADLEGVVDRLKDISRYGDGIDEALCFVESARQELFWQVEAYAPEAAAEERREREWMDAQYRAMVAVRRAERCRT